MQDTSLYEKAVAFASKAHSGVVRKGKTIPYLLHPLEASVIVSSVSEDPELLAAAVLHDVVEDTPATLDDISEEFGHRVAEIVDVLTDRFSPLNVGLSPAESWRLRKQDSLARIAAASREIKIVVLGDKLSNMRSIARDAVKRDERLWSTFKAGSREAIGWYYLSLAEALKELSDLAPWQEFDALTKATFGTQVK
ncbi:MAG: HD domain-containing protein [Lachnospiraceae bacterium]|nr:HD domain-containing protein [Lachnospiraceae bacterium]